LTVLCRLSFGRQRKLLQNESVFKGGIELGFLGANSLEKKLKKDSISFSVIKKCMAGKPK
jgi:hypothetical protein